jgi:anti-sigma B factor antagonist
MNVTERSANGVFILVLEGRIDSEGVDSLDLRLQAAASQNKYKMILDMTDVRYINSVGLRVLADMLTRCKQNGGDLKLASLNSKVRRILEIIGFDRFFSVHDTVDEAVTAFA